MSQIALHLYCNHKKVDLNEIDCLDGKNQKLVFEVLKLKYQ